MAKIISIHKNHKDELQLPTDHSGVPHLHISSTKHKASPNEVGQAEVETDYKNV